MNITEYGYKDFESIGSTEGTPARVILAQKSRFKIVCEYGETYAFLKSSAYKADSQPLPTVGDFVLIDFNPAGDSRIIQTLERKTFFSRSDPDPNKLPQAVCANFDYVFIAQSMNHDFNPRRLERYLALARESGAQPVILLTKADLAENPSPFLSSVISVAPDVPAHALSVKTGFGLDSLSPYLTPGKTVVILGSSGVGKSSLVNFLMGEEVMKVNSVREDDDKGRHTTTHRELFMLKNGAMLIDTPGMRQLGMTGITDGIDLAFPDVERFLGKCRFSDCSHTCEPGCAIQRAIQSGELSEKRFKSYLSLQSEAHYAESKAEFLQKKRSFMKEISKYSRKRKNRYDD